MHTPDRRIGILVWGRLPTKCLASGLPCTMDHGPWPMGGGPWIVDRGSWMVGGNGEAFLIFAHMVQKPLKLLWILDQWCKNLVFS